MNREFPPLFFFALSYVFGVILASLLNSLSFFLALLIFAFLGFYFLRKILNLTFLVCCLLFLFLGVFLASFAFRSVESSLLLKLTSSSPCVISGRVIETPEVFQRKAKFLFTVKEVRKGEKIFRCNETTQVVLRNLKGGVQISQGDFLVLKGVFLPRRASRSCLLSTGIQTNFIINSSRDVSFLPKRGVYGAVYFTRKKMLKILGNFLTSKDFSLLTGILLGEKNNLSDELKNDFRRTGLSHIIVVSGLHVGMFMVIWERIFYFLRFKAGLRCFLTALILVFYAFLVGFSPSVLRATIMGVAAIFAYFFGKDYDPLASVSLALILLLVYSPLFLFNISFQLSFAAVFSLVLFSPVLDKRINISFPRTKSIIVATLSAQLGVIPLLALYFRQVSFVSIFANLLVVPVVAPVLGLSFLGIFLGIFWPLLASPIFLVVGLLLSYIRWISHLLSAHPAASVFVEFRPYSALVYYFLLVGVMVLLEKKKNLNFNFGFLLILFLSFMLAASGWQCTRSAYSHRFRVTFFDVGQGDAALIKTPEGYTALIDGGENPKEIGRKLAEEGAGRIDVLFLSHPHYDHVGGLEEVLESYNVGMVVDAGIPHTSFAYRRFLEKVDEKGITYRVGRKGKSFTLGKLKLYVLHPTDEFVKEVENINEGSLVVKAVYKDISILFAGDVEQEAERELNSLTSYLRADILKVPHHGSANGGNWAFFKNVNPKVAVISVGKDNPFGHPANTTLSKLKSLGAQIFRTDEDGDIKLISDGKTFRITTER